MNSLLYNGYNIISDPNMFKLIVDKWCRSKRKRIRKKWEKMCFRTGRYLKHSPNLSEVFVSGHNIICHPSIYEKLKRSVEEA